MTMSGVGGFAAGVGTQAAKNVVLEPLWGRNEKSSDGPYRAGQITADVAAIVGGGALAVTQARSLARLVKAQPDGGLLKGVQGPAFNAVGRKIGAGALALAGVGILAAGIANLGWSRSGNPPTPPTPPVPPTPNPEPPVPPTPNPEPPVPPTPHPEPPTPPAPPIDPPQVPPTGPTDPIQGPPTDPGQWPIHTVRPGEFLDFIARCNDINWRPLYWYNRDVIGDNPDQIRVGMQLRVPPQGIDAPGFGYTPSFDPNGEVPDLECSPVHPVCEKRG